MSKADLVESLDLRQNTVQLRQPVSQTLDAALVAVQIGAGPRQISKQQ